MTGTHSQFGTPEQNKLDSEEQGTKKTTKVEPFNLTTPKPKQIPLPELIPRNIIAKPVP
jgi:hypothetical protein